jgi:hypothetical protein
VGPAAFGSSAPEKKARTWLFQSKDEPEEFAQAHWSAQGPHGPDTLFFEVLSAFFSVYGVSGVELNGFFAEKTFRSSVREALTGNLHSPEISDGFRRDRFAV